MHYWKNHTWIDSQTWSEGRLRHTASNQFRERGVTLGCLIYVVTVIDGQLMLGGRMEVGKLVTLNEARKELPYEPWEARDHAMAKRGTGTMLEHNRSVSTTDVRKLKVITRDGDAPLLKEGEPLDPQTMRRLRELTEESARILDRIIDSRARSRATTNARLRPRSLRDHTAERGIELIVVDPPDSAGKGQQVEQVESSYARGKIDRAGTDAANRKLGEDGEDLVERFERRRLTQERRGDLAAKVRRVSATEGDGAGYDILSFTREGHVKYIEVKTTKGGKRTPFIVTSNEVAFSVQHPENYSLYRVFNFGRKPRLFTLDGSLREQRCRLAAATFTVTF
jgi:hypothetical protein